MPTPCSVPGRLHGPPSSCRSAASDEPETLQHERHPITKSNTASPVRIQVNPRSPNSARLPVPISDEPKSVRETPRVIAIAAANATSRPPSAVASAMTAEAVVAKKIHAPGFTSTSTTPRAVGPSPTPRHGTAASLPACGP